MLLRRQRDGAAFTLLELMTVIMIIAILAVLALPLLGKYRARAQRAQCSANLRSLYTAADLYVQQNGSWPQIRLQGDADAALQDYANEWIAALTPFGIERKTWICPTRQEAERTEYWKPEYARIDYLAMTFDDKPTTPHEWPNFLWFAESEDMHGTGPLMILSDGSIKDLNTIAAQASVPPR